MYWYVYPRLLWFPSPTWSSGMSTFQGIASKAGYNFHRTLAGALCRIFLLAATFLKMIPNIMPTAVVANMEHNPPLYDHFTNINTIILTTIKGEKLIGKWPTEDGWFPNCAQSFNPSTDWGFPGSSPEEHSSLPFSLKKILASTQNHSKFRLLLLWER